MTVDMDYLSIWDEYQSKYSHLKKKFLEISSLHVNSTNLDNIKLFYEHDINSKRVSDDIKDLEGLLKVLENRSVLSYNKIDALKDIAETYIKDTVLSQVIKDYESQLQSHQTLPLFNVYKYRSGEYSGIVTNDDHLCNNNTNNQLEEPNDHEDTSLLHIEPTINYLQSTPENIFNLQSNNEIKQSTLETIKINQNTFNNIYVSQDDSKLFLKYILACLSVLSLVIVLIIILYFIIPYVKSPALAASTSSSAGSESTQSTGYYQTHATTSSYDLPTPETKTFRVTDLQEKIFQLISENIGRYWRDLARILGVKEAQIDSIELKDTPIENKSFQTLKIFMSRCEPCEWEIKLIRSLNIIRRKDLAEMVEDFLAKSN